jgi:hypothetical protein
MNREEDGATRAAGPASRVRWPTVGLLYLASMAHIPVVPEHLEEAPYMGVLFIAFTLAAFGLAVGITVRPSPVMYLTAAVLSAAAVCAFAATRLVAFPLLSDDVGNWAEPLGLVSVVAETGVVVLVGLSRRQPSAPAASGSSVQT